MVSILTESIDGRKYWNKLKQRLKDEENETVTNCHQLKLKAKDGKYRLTDVWQSGRIKEGREVAILTNEIYKSWSGMTAKEYKSFKGLRKEYLRDNMSDLEEEIGKSVITKDNTLLYEYKEEKLVETYNIS